MVHKIKVFKVIILFFILLLLTVLAFILRGNIETNLLRTILPQSVISSSDIVPVADKSSSVIKVVFEANDEISLEKLKDSFINELQDDYFEMYKPDFSGVVAQYISQPQNFLSAETRELLKDKKYDEVYTQALERLYSPATVQLTTFDKDPYSLVNDFIISVGRFSEKEYNANGKYYDYLSLKIKENEGLSPELTNSKISQLVNLQKKISNTEKKIYLSGSPIHSYYTRNKSITDINVICILSVFMILALTYFYFKKISLLIPVSLSIIIGILSGYCATKLWFSNFQIITMVFSTTLIGIGIDYSYHYFFAEKDDKLFAKNLTFSLLTTVIPFAILYLTGIELLKQISVFTVVGLISIFAVVLIFYPLFGNYKPQRTINPNKKVYCYILSLLLLLSIIGFLRLKFNDSLSALYSPDANLKQAETIYNKVSGENNSDTQIITVKGSNLNEILIKEERIADELSGIDYISLSKFMPSVSKQQENFKLIKELYNNNLQNFSDLLSKSQISSLINIPYTPVEFDSNSFLSEFMLDNNTSLMFVFTNNTITLSEEGVNIVNIKTDIQNYLKEYRESLLAVFPIVIAVLFFVLIVLYGFKKAVKVISPPLIGIICSVGIVSFLLGELNLFGIIACFLILGFTMDYSIFRVNGKKQTEDAILISGFTTMFSFLLLSLCGIKLLSSIALVLFFGIFVSYLLGFLLFSKKSENRK